jgi:hypothetical protein
MISASGTIKRSQGRGRERRSASSVRVAVVEGGSHTDGRDAGRSMRPDIVGMSIGGAGGSGVRPPLSGGSDASRSSIAVGLRSFAVDTASTGDVACDDNSPVAGAAISAGGSGTSPGRR